MLKYLENKKVRYAMWRVEARVAHDRCPTVWRSATHSTMKEVEAMGFFDWGKEHLADQKAKAHNKGQEDAAKGEHSPPYAILEEILSPSDDFRQVNNAYRDGHNHHTEQKKSSR